MDMRCPKTWLHPTHRWIDTDSNGYLCYGEPLASEHEPVSTSKTALDQLAGSLDGRSIGMHAGGLYWDRLPGYPYTYLTETEVRRLTSLFLLLALEMTEPRQVTFKTTEKTTHDHDWKTQSLLSGGTREVCLDCGVARA